MAVKNVWHDVEIGKGSPQIVNAIIEIPKDGQIKYEFDKETGLLKLDRFLYSAMHYPGDYGFVPKTLWSDGDPLDIIILSGKPVFPMTLVKAKPIGVIRMIDGNDDDDKILAVHYSDPRFKEIESIKDVPKHILVELKHFFETYKELQGKECKILEMLDKAEAYKIIEKAINIYKMKFDIEGFERGVVNGY